MRLAAKGNAELTAMHVSYFSVPKAGELANGDRALFRSDEHQRVLLALIDGLGHGPEAAKAAASAIDELEGVSLSSSLLEMMERVHASLRGTRGAAGTVSLLQNGKIQACGVGNVELRSAETAIPFVFSPGILGARVQKFRVCEAPIQPRTRLVMFSDGISTRLRLDQVRGLSPEEACATIIERHRKSEDDATVLVADLR
jgi:negative regulator of sigma-B (phosphoserine phosphatase)